MPDENTCETHTRAIRFYLHILERTCDFLVVDTGASAIVPDNNSPKLKGRIHTAETVSILGIIGETNYSSDDDNSIQIGTIKRNPAKDIPAEYRLL